MVKLSVENIGQDAMDYNLAKAGYTAFYVDGTNGLDTYPGDSWDQPFKTIQHAVDTAESWANIFIKAGTYAENVTINKDSISLIGESRDDVKIAPSTGTALTISNPNFSATSLSTVSNGSEVYSIKINGTHCTLSNIGVIATVSSGRGIYVNASYSTLHQIYASDALMDLAIVFKEGIHDSEVADSYLNLTSDVAYVIMFADNASNIIIRNNTFTGNADTGVYAFYGVTNNTIFHNNFLSVTHPINGSGCDFFENYYSDHTNIDNGFGIATEPYTYGSTTDPRPVVCRNGWEGLSWADADLVADILANQSGTETISSTDLPNDTAENTIIEVTTTKRLRLDSVWLDFVNLVQNVTIKVYHKIDGTNYRQYDEFSWSTSEEDGILLKDITINGDWKLTVTSSVAQGAVKAIPYNVIKTTMEA